MTTKRILWTDPGTGGIVQCAPCEGPMQGESEADYLQRVGDLVAPVGIPYHVVDISEMPSDIDQCSMVGGKPLPSLSRARPRRRAVLLAERDARLTRVRRREQEAREDGLAAAASQLRARAVELRQIEAQVDADLAGIADLAGLGAYQPAAFGQAD